MLQTYDQLIKATEDVFIKEIACSRNSGIEVSWLPWAYFRLGMFKSILSMDLDPFKYPENVNYILPLITSLAALGRHAEARKLLADMNMKTMPESLRSAISSNISTFMPNEALSLLETLSCEVDPNIVVMTYLRSGNLNAASKVIDAHTANDSFRELDLYRLAANQTSPEFQLKTINRLLTASSLSEIRLKERHDSLNPDNIVSTTRSASCGGPLVSVLMTAYNSQKRIESAIESLLQQSYLNLEIIVVDDGSVDDTCKIVERMRKADSRVSLIRLPCNVGTYMAKSIGLEFASGDFVTCMDTDDWSHPQKIEVQANELIKDPTQVANLSCCIRVYDNGILDVSGYQRPIRINHSSLMFRREEVLETSGAWCWFVRECSDTEIITRLRLIFGSERVRRLPVVLSIVSRHDESLTSIRRFNSNSVLQTLPTSWISFTEAYVNWYIRCLIKGILPKIDSPYKRVCAGLPFESPEEIVVNPVSIMKSITVNGRP